MWKDISSYSQREKDRTPKTWQFISNGVLLVVTRHIHLSPDVWAARCEPSVSLVELKSKDIDDAKKEAVSLVVNSLTKAIAGFSA